MAAVNSRGGCEFLVQPQSVLTMLEPSEHRLNDTPTCGLYDSGRREGRRSRDVAGSEARAQLNANTLLRACSSLPQFVLKFNIQLQMPR